VLLFSVEVVGVGLSFGSVAGVAGLGRVVAGGCAELSSSSARPSKNFPVVLP